MHIEFANRGSAILYRFLKSLNRQQHFLLPANVCPIVPAVFYKANISFEFIDINPQTLCIDFDTTRKTLRSKSVTGLLYVHTFGADWNVEQTFLDLKKEFGRLVIIDDRCLAVPQFEIPNTCADIVLFSTGYSKVVDYNWGAWAFSNVMLDNHTQPFSEHDHEELIDKFKTSLDTNKKFVYTDSQWLDLREFKDKEHYLNRVKNSLSSSLALKKELNEIYYHFIPPEIQLPEIFQTWRFSILVPDKNDLMKAIFNSGLFASSHYASLSGIFGPGSGNTAKKLYSQIINLFNDFRFNKEKAEKVCKIILQHI